MPIRCRCFATSGTPRSPLDPTAWQLDEGSRFPICRPDPLRTAFASVGLAQVETRAITVPVTFYDFEDFWSPFLSGQAPAPGYVASLDDRSRAALRDRLQSTLPIAADGSIHMQARAWAIRGTRH